MHDLRGVPKEVLREIARIVKLKTDLYITAIEKFLPENGRITVEVVHKATELYDEANKLAEKIPEEQRYSFARDYIQNFKA